MFMDTPTIQLMPKQYNLKTDSYPFWLGCRAVKVRQDLHSITSDTNYQLSDVTKSQKSSEIYEKVAYSLSSHSV